MKDNSAVSYVHINRTVKINNEYHYQSAVILVSKQVSS